ncbi:MAG: isocitrate lyase/PEP mutase family protein [Chitinophagaceae bacterium]
MTLLQPLGPDLGILFKQLHHQRKILVLPNIWDPLGALLLENLGYPAIATASASIAYSRGYQDGEKIPFNELLMALKAIVTRVKIPVTADIESGYAPYNSLLQENIKKLINVGIAGINFEDSHPDTRVLFPMEEQCERIHLIQQTAQKMGMPLFINARTDVYLPGQPGTDQKKLSEAIRRTKAYISSGADGVYPIFMKKKEDIAHFIEAVQVPVNLLMVPGIPDFKTLAHLGLARLSLGPGFLKTALQAMKSTAEKLLNEEGMQDVTDNSLTAEYLKKLMPDQPIH